MDGINISFGIGAFPFTLMGGVSTSGWGLNHYDIMYCSQCFKHLETNSNGVSKIAMVVTVRFNIPSLSLPPSEVPPHRPNDPRARADEQRVARVFIMVAFMVLILIIFT